MAKIKTSMRLEEEYLNAVDNIILMETTTTEKFETLLALIRNNYNYAMQSITDMFTVYETMYMLQAFNGTYPEYNMTNIKNYLIQSIEEFYNYGSMGYFSDVDPFEDLMYKLDNVTDFQAFAILNSIYTFWSKKNEGVKQPTDLLMCKQEKKENHKIYTNNELTDMLKLMDISKEYWEQKINDFLGSQGSESFTKVENIKIDNFKYAGMELKNTKHEEFEVFIADIEVKEDEFKYYYLIDKIKE